MCNLLHIEDIHFQERYLCQQLDIIVLLGSHELVIFMLHIKEMHLQKTIQD
jgi:hypothetical protein